MRPMSRDMARTMDALLTDGSERDQQQAQVAIAHLLTWAHLSTDCPICRAEQSGITLGQQMQARSAARRPPWATP
jgi:hypothetical protein